MKVVVKFLYLVSFFCANCNSNPKNLPTSKTSKDSLTSTQSGKGNLVHSEDMSASDFHEIIDKYNDYLKYGEVIDTTIKLGPAVFKITLEHHSRSDSSIVVPEKYVGIYGMKQFISNTFQSHLTVHKNGTPMVDKIITRESFNSLTDEPMRRLGVLLYPYIDVCDGQIEIHYSLTIPLTDVGVNVKIVLLADGRMTILDGDSC